MLEKMLEMQRELQVKHYGAAPDTLEGKERIQFVKDMHIALTDELHEALAEVSWKPWAKAEYFNEAAYKGELVDAFHFFMNLMMAGHITAEDLFEGYVKKNALNAKRQIEGYDGVSTKCPGCGRALDDEAVKCTKSQCSVQIRDYLKEPRPGTSIGYMSIDEAFTIEDGDGLRKNDGAIRETYDRLAVDSLDYNGRLKKIMEENLSLTRQEAKALLYKESYGGKAASPIERDYTKPMRRPSGRFPTSKHSMGEALNDPVKIEVNPIDALAASQIRMASQLPHVLGRKNLQ
jgi:dimeric dUTPase (all-alpha-NTP-PPase superfamily)